MIGGSFIRFFLCFGEYHLCSKKDRKYSITALGFRVQAVILHSVWCVNRGDDTGYTFAKCL